MENKIAISSLAANLAQSTGKTKKLCEDFLREYFKLLSESLEAGESIKIKGFGSFKVVEVEAREAVNVNTGEKQEIASYKKVVFTPAKEFANEINAPFVDFESVEMEDEMPEEVFVEASEQEAIDSQLEANKEDSLSNEDNISDERLEVGSEEEDSDDLITYEAYQDIEEEQEKTKEAEGMKEVGDETKESMDPAEGKTVVFQADEPNEDPQIVLPVYDDPSETKSRFGIGFLVGALSTFAVCALIFMLGCFFDWWPVNFGNPTESPVSQVSQPTVEEPGVEEIKEQEVAEPVYDTVSTTRYLTTIAREHYGNFNFWPYIYQENKDILGHPDRITPGTRVVVPDLSKYGLDPSNPADEEAAKKLSAEIYSRFK